MINPTVAATYTVAHPVTYLTVASSTAVPTLAPPIPFGCICAYTWSPMPGRQVRNGAILSCAADHTAVDGLMTGA